MQGCSTFWMQGASFRLMQLTLANHRLVGEHAVVEGSSQSGSAHGEGVVLEAVLMVPADDAGVTLHAFLSIPVPQHGWFGVACCVQTPLYLCCHEWTLFVCFRPSARRLLDGSMVVDSPAGMAPNRGCVCCTVCVYECKLLVSILMLAGLHCDKRRSSIALLRAHALNCQAR